MCAVVCCMEGEEAGEDGSEDAQGRGTLPREEGLLGLRRGLLTACWEVGCFGNGKQESNVYL